MKFGNYIIPVAAKEKKKVGGGGGVRVWRGAITQKKISG